MHTAAWRRGIALLMVGGAAGCSKPGEQAAAPAPPNAVDVTAVNYSFSMPDSIPAGVTTIRLVNKGTELHHIQLVRLLQGRTVDSLVAALKHPGPFPAWAQLVGGPNAAAPNDTTRATVTLAAGHYAVLCLIPGTDNVPHFAKGMIRPLQVTGSAPENAAEPAADVTMHVKDYEFALSAPLTAGTHTVNVVNDGPQPHEAVLVQLAPGKTMQDLLSWETHGMQGPPPGKPIGGVSVLTPGRHAEFTATLTPGSYGFICFVPAPDGKEHAAHGMVKQLTVS